MMSHRAIRMTIMFRAIPAGIDWRRRAVHTAAVAIV
jgi:hypothetical protein